MEIRFRVWDGEKMWYPEENATYILNQKGNVWHGRWGDYRRLDVKPPTAMLSMGFKDKDGKEIWEGDLVSISDRKGEKYVAEAGIGSLFRIQAAQVIIDSETKHEWEENQDEYETIGNKYENPELVEEVA